MSERKTSVSDKCFSKRKKKQHPKKSSDAVFVFLILQGTLVSAVRGAVGTRTAHRVEYFLIRKGDFDGTDKVIV